MFLIFHLVLDILVGRSNLIFEIILINRFNDLYIDLMISIELFRFLLETLKVLITAYGSYQIIVIYVALGFLNLRL